MPSLQQRPFLKWAGGKGLLAKTILGTLPAGQRLIEPFVGSGAIFLNATFPKCLLNDINQDLIDLYKTIQQQGSNFIDYAQTWFTPSNNTEKRYYQLREQFNQTQDVNEKTALFIYLNRHGYNGLCRYNRNGDFNVPYGRYLNPGFPKQALLNFLQKSKKVTFCCDDFAKIMLKAKKGDVIYCDPPYVPLSKTARFSAYHGSVFDEAAQQRLAKVAMTVSQKGIPVLISNHDTPFTREIYQHAQLTTLDVARRISCKGSQRNRVAELLALFK